MICTYKILIVNHFLCGRYTLILCTFCYACRSRYILYLVPLFFCQSEWWCTFLIAWALELAHLSMILMYFLFVRTGCKHSSDAQAMTIVHTQSEDVEFGVYMKWVIYFYATRSKVPLAREYEDFKVQINLAARNHSVSVLLRPQLLSYSMVLNQDLFFEESGGGVKLKKTKKKNKKTNKKLSFYFLSQEF